MIRRFINKCCQKLFQLSNYIHYIRVHTVITNIEINYYEPELF